MRSVLLPCITQSGKVTTNSPNGVQPGSAPGNWSVVNRPALYKPHPENILFDIRRLQRRSSRARRSLISLQVLAAARECTAIRIPCTCSGACVFPMVPMLSVPLRPMTQAAHPCAVKRAAWRYSSVRRWAGGSCMQCRAGVCRDRALFRRPTRRSRPAACGFAGIGQQIGPRRCGSERQPAPSP